MSSISPTTSTRMRAVVQDAYGTSDVLLLPSLTRTLTQQYLKNFSSHLLLSAFFATLQSAMIYLFVFLLMVPHLFSRAVRHWKGREQAGPVDRQFPKDKAQYLEGQICEEVDRASEMVWVPPTSWYHTLSIPSHTQ